ncbi:hypothetical protein D3C72_1765470 [compost metagenome]
MAFEIRDGFNRTVFRHQDNFGLRLSRLYAHVNQISACGLGEYRRNISRTAYIYTAHIECFEHLWASREFNPRKRRLRITFFQQLMAFCQHHADAAFLVADT